MGNCCSRFNACVPGPRNCPGDSKGRNVNGMWVLGMADARHVQVVVRARHMDLRVLQVRDLETFARMLRASPHSKA
jgi:hypothetical protein